MNSQGSWRCPTSPRRVTYDCTVSCGLQAGTCKRPPEGGRLFNNVARLPAELGEVGREESGRRLPAPAPRARREAYHLALLIAEGLGGAPILKSELDGVTVSQDV